MTIVIVFIVWLTVKLSQGKTDRQEKTRAFWEKERSSNMVPKKSLDDLHYIQFPFELLPATSSFTEEGQNIPSSLLMLNGLRGKKIVNFNNISNTDLKLTYGTANITLLTEYDTNFITLCREGNLLTQYLAGADRKEEARVISEALIRCGSDVVAQYVLLFSLYEETGSEDAKNKLMLTIEQMTSNRKDAIQKALQELLEQPAKAVGSADEEAGS
ncbi:MAG: hypothetical protein K6E18_10345 [Lachnospiraceae bacterium]|nr:hypothetical protein [Lachnospiraceae bacterium]